MTSRYESLVCKGMACEKNNPMFLEFLDHYNGRSFVKPDGTLDLTTNVKTITEQCQKHGWQPNGCYQEINGFALYPKDYFCPKDWWTGKVRSTKNTVAIHHFDGSWGNEDERYFTKVQQKLRRFLPQKIAVKTALVMQHVKYK